uniref:Uncharacterized protein n=1 Tax=Mus musculus TaxID=10090 RepID=Q9D4Z6_MOUSE|nr:unnamed protein product [Mus musculus]
MQGPYSETASFAALSGGTLSGGILSSGKGKYSRLEVQADVQKEIFPKDTASLGAISDSASTRAMAGSIISSYNPQDRECNNMEIQVDIEAKPSHYQLVYLLPYAVKDGASRQQPLWKILLLRLHRPPCISLHIGTGNAVNGLGVSVRKCPRDVPVRLKGTCWGEKADSFGDP